MWLINMQCLVVKGYTCCLLQSNIIMSCNKVTVFYLLYLVLGVYHYTYADSKYNSRARDSCSGLVWIAVNVVPLSGLQQPRYCFRPCWEQIVRSTSWVHHLWDIFKNFLFKKILDLHLDSVAHFYTCWRVPYKLLPQWICIVILLLLSPWYTGW